MFTGGAAIGREQGSQEALEDSLVSVPLYAPQKRISNVYQWGEKRVVLEVPNPQLIPIGAGVSMLPLVSSGHYVLITTSFAPNELSVGDYVVVTGLTDRYFHQIVAVEQTENGYVFTTRGIANNADDFFPVFEKDIVGVAVAVIW